MSHVVTNQPVPSAPAYDIVMNEAPELNTEIPGVQAPNPEEELKRNDARKEQAASVGDCCCYIDDDADFFCVSLVRLMASMFHGIGICLDSCFEGCADCINSCCNDESCCDGNAAASDAGGGDCDCADCDCADCNCSGCFD